MRATGLLIAALLLAGAAAAQAQPVVGACMLVCFPPAHLNAKKCACEAASPARGPACSLVCLDPDTTLDARKCACVRRSR